MIESHPRGFVKTNEAIGDEIAQLDRPRDDELYQLWKAYTTNKAVLSLSEGVRLENLFWRIWSSPRIKANMSGRALANIFRPISRGDGLIMESPRPRDPPATCTSTLSHSTTSSSPDSSRSSSTVVPDVRTLPAISQFDLPPGPTTASGPEKRHSSISKPLPPPILKKARPPSDGMDDVPGDQPSSNSQRDSETGSSQANVWSRQNVQASVFQRDMQQRGGTSGKKRTSFDSPPLALLKAKSPITQHDNPSSPSRNDLTKRSPHPTKTSALKARAVRQNSNIKRDTPPPQLSAGTTLTANSHPSSWQDVDSSEPDEALAPLKPQPAEWLVDKNFRGKFVDSRRNATSQTNLAGLGKNLSVRFLDQLPQQKPGDSSSEKISDQGTDFGTQGKTTMGVSDGLAIATPSALQESQQDALPRTKSHLSIMVDLERRSGALKGSDKDGERVRQATRESQLNQETSSEEEGIVMGTGVGRTKVIKRGKKSDKRKDASAHYHSQIPDPVW